MKFTFKGTIYDHDLWIDNGNFLEHFLVELITIQQNNNSPYHFFGWNEPTKMIS
jgi:hypothetical protein